MRSKPTKEELEALLKPIKWGARTRQNKVSIVLTKIQLKAVLEGLRIAREDSSTAAGKALYRKTYNAIIRQK